MTTPRKIRWTGAAVIAVLGGALVMGPARSRDPSGSRPNPAPAGPGAGRRLTQPAAPASTPKADPVRALRGLADAWLGTNPRDRSGRDALQNRIAAALPTADPARVLPALSAAELDSSLGAGALDRWLAVDPLAAARWVASQPNPSRDQAWAVAQRLLEDPQGFEDFCSQLADTPWKQEFLAQAGTAVVALDPLAAIEIASHMAPNPARGELMQQAFVQWLTADPDAAAAWIGTLDDTALRATLVSAAAAAVPISPP